MRIALVCNYYLSNSGNEAVVCGVTTYVEGLAAALIKRGHAVTILGPREEYEEPKTGSSGAKVVLLRYSEHSPLLFAHQVHQYLAENPHDVVEAHNWDYPLLVEQLVGGTPTVVRYASDLLSTAEAGNFPTEEPRQRSMSAYLMEQMSVRRSDLVLVAGESTGEKADQLGVRAKRLALGLSEVGEGLPYKERTKVLIWISRYDNPRKGGEFLEPLLAAIPREYPVAVLGSGATKEYQRHLTGSYANTEFIFNPVSRTGLREILESSYAAVVPTKSESFGYVLLEPMAYGCPVICFDQPDATKQKWPFLRLGDHRDPESIKNVLPALQSLSLDKGISKEVLRFAKDFLWDNLVREYEEAYSEAIRTGFLRLSVRSRGW